jgi:outer membrane biosynthesis protein TonB
MEHRPVFKTFEVTEAGLVAEAGFKEWMMILSMAMSFITSQGMSPPSHAAQSAAKSIALADCNNFKRLYKDAAIKFHPDKNKGKTNGDMALINAVYQQKREASGVCEKPNLSQRKTSEKPDKSDQPKPDKSYQPKKPKKSDKSDQPKPDKSYQPKKPKKSDKSDQPNKSNTNKKQKPKKRRKKRGRRKTEANDGISMEQVVGGICGAVGLGYAAKGSKPRRERRSRSRSPGRQTRR